MNPKWTHSKFVNHFMYKIQFKRGVSLMGKNPNSFIFVPILWAILDGGQGGGLQISPGFI